MLCGCFVGVSWVFSGCFEAGLWGVLGGVPWGVLRAFRGGILRVFCGCSWVFRGGLGGFSAVLCGCFRCLCGGFGDLCVLCVCVCFKGRLWVFFVGAWGSTEGSFEGL